MSELMSLEAQAWMYRHDCLGVRITTYRQDAEDGWREYPLFPERCLTERDGRIRNLENHIRSIGKVLSNGGDGFISGWLEARRLVSQALESPDSRGQGEQG